ncbi:hypothetical protein KAI87_12340 [Myxococcota bacterium]|nr:hypothetical protein [Myxococcota bacterium]
MANRKGIQKHNEVVVFEKGEHSGSVQIAIGLLKVPARAYEANWFDIEEKAGGAFALHFGQTIPMTKNLSTVLSINFSSRVFVKEMEQKNQEFHEAAKIFVESRGLGADLPDIDRTLISKVPPKTHLLHASIFSMAFWEGDAQMSFYYLSPATFQQLQQGTERKAEKLVEDVVTVKLSCSLLLSLLDQLYGER